MSDFNPLDRAKIPTHRSSFDLSSKKLFTAKVGEILPCYWQIAIPGTKYRISSDWFTRTVPVNTAAYTRIKEYYDFYAVPLRLISRALPQAFTQMTDYMTSAASNSANTKQLSSVPYAPVGNISAEIQACVTAGAVLITGTFTVIRQVCYMQSEASVDSHSRMLVIKYPSFTEGLALRLESFTKRLKQRADVSHVTVSGAVPGVEVANYFTNRPYGSDPSQVKLIQMFAVDYDYLSAYMPAMICGRYFSEDFGGDLNRIVLNEEAVRLLGYESPEAALGQQVKMEVVGEPLEIIGVVKNYHQQSLSVAYKPIIFFMKERVPFIATPYISVRLTGEGEDSALMEIEQMYHEYFPTSLFSYFFLSDLNTFLYKSDRNFGWIFASASLIAIFVACLGLWIVTLFSTLSRLKEVGIRKVLGANKSSLFFILTKELMLLTILASAIGIPVSAVLMNGWLETYAFHISLPWWIYAVVFALLMLIAFLTVFQQVWRIICLKPMSILKYE
mgnify:CR=1 FL=1